jgi:signal transduction histidine kinase
LRLRHKLSDLDLAKIEDAYQAEDTARLQRIERLATLGRIAFGVAHELRNPFNVVQASLQFSAAYADKTSSTRRALWSR